MATYTATVMETVTNEVRYTIEADSQEEANAKADIGDTVGEERVRTHGVVSRDVETVVEDQMQKA